jgi:hypothetical protein
MWTICREHEGSPNTYGYYKTKVYHMDDDEFRVKMYPEGYIDAIRYAWFSRTFFRIL